MKSISQSTFILHALICAGGILLVFASLCNAQQAPAIQWELSLGGTDIDDATSIAITRDSGLIVSGFTQSDNGIFFSQNHGDDDYYIVKLDKSGNVQWQRLYGGSDEDIPSTIQQTRDGGYFIAGYSYSNDGDVTGNHGGVDYWVVKIDSSGNIQWEHCYGGSDGDVANSAAQTKDGGYIVAGTSLSINGDVTPPSIRTGNGKGDFCWVVKLDSIGNIQWEHSYGGSIADNAQNISQTYDGGYIISGDAIGNGGDVTGNHGDADYWVVKIDSMGNKLWEKSFGGSGTDQSYSMQQTRDSGFIITGYSNSINGDVTGNHGGYDCWVIKLNDTGKIIWENSYGGSNNDGSGYFGACNSIVQTKEGGYIIAIGSNSNDQEVTGNHGNYDYWIVKIDSLGKIQWEQSYGGSDDDEPTSIQQALDGGYVIVGGSSSIDGEVTDNHGKIDYWIVKLAPSAPQISSVTEKSNQYLSCSPHLYDTIWVHNIGGSTLYFSSVSFQLFNQKAFSFVSPQLPDSILSNDSVPCIISFSPDSSIVDSTILNIFSNDTMYSPWQIHIIEMKDSIGFSLQGIKDDTIDFGNFCNVAAKDSSFIIENTSSISTLFDLQLFDTTLFTITGFDTLGMQITVNVHCAEGQLGRYIVPLFISDTCSLLDTVYLKVDFQNVTPVLAQHDTTICTGDSVLITAPGGFASYNWSDGETTQSIIVKTTGVYSVTVQNSLGCSGMSDSVRITVCSAAVANNYRIIGTLSGG